MLGKIKKLVTSLFNPLALFLIRLGITPNYITILGLFLSALSAIFILGGHLDVLFHISESTRLVTAAVLLLFSGFCDLLDGLVARLGSMETPFGGFFDSVLDRYSEVFFITALICAGYCSILWGLLALSGSLLVSYARAKCEVAGLPGVGVGIAERPERLLILGGATFMQGFFYPGKLAFAPYIIEAAVIIVAVLSHITVLQRGYYAWTSLRK